MTTTAPSSFAVTRNACKLCTPLGACWVFKGVEGAVPLIHGSQGCATYIRRYMISHFREPVDIASSSFGESAAIFGGGENLKVALDNVIAQYRPRLVGVATTCLSETIGDDVVRLVRRYLAEHPGAPRIVAVSTPSYRGTHAEGFHRTVHALVAALAVGPASLPAGAEASSTARRPHINLFPGMLSPEDLRHLKEIVAAFGQRTVLLPDYSETLDAPTQSEYERMPRGGTSVRAIARTGSAKASIEFGRTLSRQGVTAASFLKENFGVPRYALGVPIGIRETDAFFNVLAELSGRAIPRRYRLERGRLVDAYVDGHKYVFGKRAVIYGEEDLVVGLAAFLSEIGVAPVLCASGGASGQFADRIRSVVPENSSAIVRDGADFAEIEEEAASLAPDLIIGNSKGYALSRKLNAPLLRVGFPVHDRLGAQRVLHVGYRGTQRLFDQVVNALIQRKQDASPTGYSYV
jgi:nitrogenase molybdenum-iron protein NifN